MRNKEEKVYLVKRIYACCLGVSIILCSLQLAPYFLAIKSPGLYSVSIETLTNVLQFSYDPRRDKN